MQHTGPGPASGGREVPQTCLLLEALKNTAVWHDDMNYYVIWKENSWTSTECDDICSDIKAHDLKLMGLFWQTDTFKEVNQRMFATKFYLPKTQ